MAADHRNHSDSGFSWDRNLAGEKNFSSHCTDSLLPTLLLRHLIPLSSLQETVSPSPFSQASLGEIQAPTLYIQLLSLSCPYSESHLAKEECFPFSSSRFPLWPSSFSLVVPTFSCPRMATSQSAWLLPSSLVTCSSRPKITKCCVFFPCNRFLIFFPFFLI